MRKLKILNVNLFKALTGEFTLFEGIRILIMANHSLVKYARSPCNSKEIHT
jgi:hypothetical protein